MAETKRTVVVPNSGPSILDAAGEGEEDTRQKYYETFVRNKEQTQTPAVVQDRGEEVKKENKKGKKTGKHGKKAKKGKQAGRKEVLSTRALRAELAGRMGHIQSRLASIQEKAHDELVYAEDEYSVKNMDLLEKLFPTFLEMIAVRWEEISDSLIDDLLCEVVGELNVIDSAKRAQGQIMEKKKEVDKTESEEVDVLGVLNDFLVCEQSMTAKYKALS